MTKSKLKNLIKLIVACLTAVIFTVIAVVYIVQDNAHAWFTINNLVSADGTEIGVAIPEGIVKGSAEYFKYSEKDENSYTFERSESSAMEMYDSSINNDYQIVIKINLTASTESVTVAAYTTAEKYLGADDAGELASADNSLSSVVSFEIYYSDSTVVSETVSDGVTTSVTLTPPTPVTEYTFINEDKTLASSVRLGETHTFSGTSDNAVYIVVKYNSDAIDEIISLNIGNDVFSGDSNITFMCDFSFSVS
ncbi:MAG: hypothetical protein ACI4MN_05390 [Candidatus Coproplasma sp.]